MKLKLILLSFSMTVKQSILFCCLSVFRKLNNLFLHLNVLKEDVSILLLCSYAMILMITQNLQ